MCVLDYSIVWYPRSKWRARVAADGRNGILQPTKSVSVGFSTTRIQRRNKRVRTVHTYFVSLADVLFLGFSCIFQISRSVGVYRQGSFE